MIRHLIWISLGAMVIAGIGAFIGWAFGLQP